MNAESLVVDLIALNGHELVGRTRLQKQTYLLDRCGANIGLRYTYHHYGPYSFDLAEGVDYAHAEGWIVIKERIGRHRVPYAIFKTDNDVASLKQIGALPADEARTLIDRMKGASDIVLELAATIVFLRDEWDYFDKDKVSAVAETKARKPLKATEERINLALALLDDLIWPLRRHRRKATSIE